MSLEEYELLINKARENIEISELLFDNDKLGNASFHAQQAIELSIKSYVIKFNLLEGIRRDNLFKTHMPSKILLKDIFRYLTNELYELENKKKTKKWLIKLLNQSENRIHKTINIMKKVDANKNELENLWKMSLGITINDSRVPTYFKELLEPDETLSRNMTLEIIYDFQKAYDGVIKQAIKLRLTHKIPEIQKQTIKRSKKYGIPEKITKMFFEQEKPDIIIQEIEKLDPDAVDVIGGLYNKDGVADLQGKTINTENKKQKEQQIMLRIKYLEELNSIVLLTYPHEQIGRYARMINGKNTEQWYDEKRSELKDIIVECREVFERTYSIIKTYGEDVPLPTLNKIKHKITV